MMKFEIYLQKKNKMPRRKIEAVVHEGGLAQFSAITESNSAAWVERVSWDSDGVVVEYSQVR